MMKGEAKVLETDVVLFPLEFNQEKENSVLIEETGEKIIVEKESIKVNFKDRFARLKKSLRKRSASIL